MRALRCSGILSMSMTSRDLHWLIYIQNVAVAAPVVTYVVGGVQVAVDFDKVVVEAVEAGVAEVVIVVAVVDLGVAMVAVVPTEVAVVHNLLFH